MPGDDRDQISLVVGDDHRMLTDLLKIVIDDDPDVRLVADPVDNAKDAIELCARYRPDVVLMDIQLRGELNGVDATKLIRRVSPSTKVIIMSGSYSYEAALLKVAEAGACGFLDKADAAEDVVGAVKAAAAGEMLIEPHVLNRLLHQLRENRESQRSVEMLLGRLTEREREILQLLAYGSRREDIAWLETRGHRREALHQPQHREHARPERASQAGRPLQARGGCLRREARCRLCLAIGPPSVNRLYWKSSTRK